MFPPAILKKRECLVIGDDHTALTAARALGLATERSAQPATVARLLSSDRFAIVVLDGEMPDAQQHLLAVREYCTRNTAVSLLLLPEEGSLPRGFGRGATLVVRKPLTAEAARTALRSALHLTRPQRRRTLRLSLEPLVHIACGGRSQRGQVLDVSESGIAVCGCDPLPRGAAVQLRLLLPGMKSPIEVNGTVARCAAERVGIRFGKFSDPDHQLQLQEWLAYLRDFARRAEPAAAPAPAEREESVRRVARPRRSPWSRMWTSVVRA